MKNLLESRYLQRAPNPTMINKLKSKLDKVKARGYSRMSNEVKSPTHFFLVPKTWKKMNNKRVADDIRMVYDAIRSGVNETVWNPWFSIPVSSHIRDVDNHTFMADCDVGEITLNFMLEH